MRNRSGSKLKLKLKKVFALSCCVVLGNFDSNFLNCLRIIAIMGKYSTRYRMRFGSIPGP